MARRSILSIALLGGLVCSPLQAEGGNDWHFIPRANVGIIDYSLKIPSLPVAPGYRFPETEFAVDFKVAELGATTSWGRYYFSVAGLMSSEESDSLSEPNYRYEENFSGDRKDFSAVLGMRATDHLSLYMGWKYGISQADGSLNSDLEFKEQGFFVGGNYAWPIADKGILAVNLAVARLDGDLTIQAPGFVVPGGSSNGFLLDAISQTTGLSYGISWHSSINDRLSYSVAFDANAYTFDDVHDAVQGEIPGTFDEKMYIFRVGLAYRF